MARQLPGKRPEALRHRKQRRHFAVAVIAILATLTGVGYAAVSSQPAVYACFGDTDGRAHTGMTEYAQQCGPSAHLKRMAADDVVAGSTTTSSTTRPTTTTTTQPTSSGTIVPAGSACPRSTSSSRYEGNRLTVAQAAQALYAGGFHDLVTIRAFIGIGTAESSLCVRTWHWHPEFGAGQADVGWLQISTHYWPQYPQSQTLDPVGAATATHTIYAQTNNLGTWDTWPSPASSLQPAVSVVCGAVPATGC